VSLLQTLSRNSQFFSVGPFSSNVRVNPVNSWNGHNSFEQIFPSYSGHVTILQPRRLFLLNLLFRKEPFKMLIGNIGWLNIAEVCLFVCLLEQNPKNWLIIVFITWNSNLVPLLEGLCTSNPCRFGFSVFWVFAGIESTTSGLRYHFTSSHYTPPPVGREVNPLGVATPRINPLLAEAQKGIYPLHSPEEWKVTQ